MIRRLVRGLDARVGTTPAARGALRKAFPDHWSFLLGEIALYCFLILVATGIYLTLFFEPSTREVVYEGGYGPLQGVAVSEAFRSVMEVSFDVRAGLVMRQMHHWAALLFVAAIVIHLARVFFTGAFRNPRELNWVVGVTLLILALANGYTGYVLPYDLMSGIALRIMYSIMLSVPFVGTWMANLVFGGEFPSDAILSRLFVVHVLLVPVALGVLIAVHLALVVRQRHTQYPRPGRTERNVVGAPLWPTHAAKGAGLFLITAGILAGLAGLVRINPVWLAGPFRPEIVTTPAQPDWFWSWLDGALRLFPAWELEVVGVLVANPFFPGVLLPALTFALLYSWPFLEAGLTGDRDRHELLDRPRDRPGRTAAGVAAITFFAVLTVAGANDVIAVALDVPVRTVTRVLRVAVLAMPPVAALAAWRVCLDLQARERQMASVRVTRERG